MPRGLSWLRPQRALALIIAICLVFWGGFVARPFFVDAQSVPTTLAYVGFLNDASGNALTGTYSMTFRVYDTLSPASTASALWSETHATVTVTNGYFTIRMGSVTPFNLTWDQQYYVGLQVGSDAEMSPLQYINSVGYSQMAQQALGVYATSSNPTTVATGSMYYNSSNGNLYYYNHLSTSWNVIGASTSTGADVAADNAFTGQNTFTDDTTLGNVSLTGTLAITGTTTFTNATGTNLYVSNNITAGNALAATSLSVSGFSSSSLLFVSGSTTFRGIEYLFPSADGSAGQVLTTDGAGGLSWSTSTVASASSSSPFVTNTADTIISPADIADILVLGASTTTTLNQLLEVAGDAQINGVLTVLGGVLTASTTVTSSLTVTGDTTLTNATATNFAVTGELAFGNATATNFAVTGDASLTDVTTTNFAATGDTTLGSATATNIFADRGQFSSVTSTNAAVTDLTFTSATGTNLALTGNLTFAGATGTNIYASNVVSSSLLVVTGSTTFRGIEYLFPAADGVSGQVLSTDGVGQLSWATTTAGAGSALFATNTDSTLISLVDTSDILVLGAAATTSLGQALEVVGNVQINNLLTVLGGVLTASTTVTSSFVVTGVTTLASATATNFAVLGDTTLAGVTSTDLAVTGDATFVDATSTNLAATRLGFGSATGTNLNITGDTTLAGVTSTDLAVTGDATLTDATTTNFAATGISALMDLTFTSATGTNLAVANLVSSSLLVVTGSTTFSGVEYLFPAADGTTGQVLSTDGAGQLSWATSTVGAGSALFTTNTASNVISQVDVTDILVLGASATTSLNQILEVAGNAQINNLLTVIGGTISQSITTTYLAVTGTANITTATISNTLTVSGDTVLADATSTNLAVTNDARFVDATTTNFAVTGDLAFGSATATNVAVVGDTTLADVTSTNLAATNASATDLTFTNATGTNLNIAGNTTLAGVTSTDLAVTGDTTLADATTTNFAATGDTILGNATSTNLAITGAFGFGSATGTNLSISNIVSSSLLVVSGSTTFRGVEYSFPGADGTSGQYLQTDGSGQLSWASVAAGGSGLFASNTANTVISPADVADILVIGAGATSTLGQILEVAGNAQVNNLLTVLGGARITGGVFTESVTTTFLSVTGTANITTVTIANALTVSGDTILADATSTNLAVSGDATFADATSTNLAVTSNATLGSATATNIFADRGQFTSVTSTNGSITNVAFGNATGTNIAVSGGATLGNVTGTNLAVTGQTALDVMSFISATGTNLAISNVVSSSLLVVSGSTTFRGIEYLYPVADGTSNQVLTTDGAGQLSWASVAGGGSGLFATNTASNVISQVDVTDILVLGASATTSLNQILEVAGNAQINNLLTVIGGAISQSVTTTYLAVTGTANITTATISNTLTVSGDTVLADATSTNLAVTGDTLLGSATATNIFADRGQFTSVTSTNGSITNVAFGSATGTNLSAAGDVTLGDATSTNLAVTGDATLTDATTTNFAVSGVLGFASATGTNIALTNNLTVSNIVSSSLLVVSGSTTFRGIEYLFPSADGTSGQYLQTDGVGQLSWASVAAGGSGLFATDTASNVISPADVSDILVLGAAATSTLGQLLEVAGNAQVNNILTVIGGTISQSVTTTYLAVTGTANITTATISNDLIVSGDTTLANATSTNLAVTRDATLTDATSTNLFANNLAATDLTVTNATGTNLNITGNTTLAGVTSTNLAVTGDTSLANATATNIFADRGQFTSVTSTNGSITNVAFGSATGTNLSAAGDVTLGDATSTNLAVTGQSTLGVTTFTSATGTNLAISNIVSSSLLVVSGSTTFRGVEYLFPGADGTSGQVLSTDGTGQLSWATASGSGSSLFTTNTADTIISPVDTADILVLGASATTSLAQLLEVAGNAQVNNILTVIGGTISQSVTTTYLAVTGTANITTATISNDLIVSGDTTLANATSTNLAVTNDASFVDATTTNFAIGASLTFGSATGTNINIIGDTSFTNATGTNLLVNNIVSSSLLVVSGSTTFRGVEYLFPGADGTNGQLLTTNGAGGLSWSSVSGVWTVGALPSIGLYAGTNSTTGFGTDAVGESLWLSVTGSVAMFVSSSGNVSFGTSTDSVNNAITVNNGTIGYSLDTITQVGALANTNTIYDMHVRGDYTYAVGANTTGLVIYDNTDRANPVQVGFLDLPGSVNAYDIVVQGQYAYIGTDYASAASGFVVVDISNPAAPVQTANLALPWHVYAVEIRGSYAYLASWIGTPGYSIRTVDISDPEAPTVVATTNFGGTDGTDIEIAGDYLYLSRGATTGDDIQIFSLATNTAELTLVGGANVTSTPRSIEVRDRYMYVASDISSQDLLVYDVVDPSSPQLVGWVDLPALANDLRVVGDIAYVVLDNAVGNELVAVDISDPTAPSLLAGADIGQQALTVDVDANHVYVGASVNATLEYQIFSSPGIDAPSAVIADLQVDELYARNRVTADRIEAGGGLYVGGNAYVQDGLSVRGGIRIASTTLSTTSQRLYALGTSLFWDGASISSIFQNTNGNDIYVGSGNIGIGTTTPAEQLTVGSGNFQVNVSSFAEVYTSSTVGDFSVNDVEIFDRYEVIATNANGGDGEIIIMDVTDPINQIRVASIEIGSPVYDVEIVGSLLYVGSLLTSNQLRIYDISDVYNPSLLSSISTGASVLDIEVVNGYVYTAESTTVNNFGIYDARDPRNVYLLSRFASQASTPQSVSVDYPYAYLTYTLNGSRQELVVVDVSDPVNPATTTMIDISGSMYNSAIRDSRLYVVGGSGTTFEIYDISSSTNPTLTFSENRGNVNYDVVLSGEHAYVAGSNVTNVGELLVYDITSSTNPVFETALDYSGSRSVYGLAVRGSYIYSGMSFTASTPEFMTHQIPFARVPALRADSIRAGQASIDGLTVAGETVLYGNTAVEASLSVGGSVIAQGGLSIASNTPATTTDQLYSLAGVLHWNGNSISTWAATAIPNPGFTAPGDTDTGLGADSNNALWLSTSGTLAFYIASSSNIGIGTSTLNADSAITVNNQHLSFGFDTFTLVSSTITTNTIRDIEVVDNIAYAVGDDTTGFVTIDVSDPSSPSILSYHDLPGTNIAYDIDVVGDLAYIATDATNSGLVIMDISNPASTTPLSVTDLEWISYDLEVQGQYAYVGTFNGSGSYNVNVFDVSDSTAPVRVGQISTASSDVQSLDIEGTNLYVGRNASTGNELQIWSFATNSISPVPLGGFDATAAINDV